MLLVLLWIHTVQATHTFYVDVKSNLINNCGESEEVACNSMNNLVVNNLENVLVLFADGVYSGSPNCLIKFKNVTNLVLDSINPYNAVIDCRSVKSENSFQEVQLLTVGKLSLYNVEPLLCENHLSICDGCKLYGGKMCGPIFLYNALLENITSISTSGRVITNSTIRNSSMEISMLNGQFIVADSTFESTKISLFPYSSLAEYLDRDNMVDIRNTYIHNSDIYIIYFCNITLMSNTIVSSKIHIATTNLVTIQGILTTGESLFSFETVLFVHIYSSTFVNITKTNSKEKYIVNVLGGTKLLVMGCDFLNNQVPGIFIFGVSSTEISISNFKNNMGRAVTGETLIPATFGSSMLLIGSEFVNNTQVEGSGGAVCITKHHKVEIQSCNFRDNHAEYGGAVFVQTMSLMLRELEFSGNRAHNHGGGLYFDHMTADFWALSNHNLFMFKIDFINNFAESGGAVYLKIESGKSVDVAARVTCINNFVTYSGGCVYSQFYIPDFLATITGVNDKALSYGNEIAYPLQNIFTTIEIQYDGNTVTQSAFPDLVLYPGQRITSVRVNITNFNKDKVQFLKSPIAVYSLDNRAAFQSTQANNDHIQDVLLILNSNETGFTMQAKFSVDFENSQMFNIYVAPCLKGSILSNSYSNGYVCVEKHSIPYEIIIPVVSIISVVAMTLIIVMVGGIVYGLKIIIKKLKILERKEKAEKEIESVLISLNSDQSSSLVKHDYLNPPKEKQYIIPIEDLELIKRIGEGANGTIYVANWNGCEVAVKTLKTESVESVHSEEFEKEAALLSTLRHPNIVNLYGVSISDTRKYMVVEYLPKGSLDKLILNCKHGTKVLSLPQKLNILLGVAKGMAYMHSLKPKPVIHRDLKPANILLDSNLCSKVCDFGLSTMLGNTNSATTNIGTFCYMSTVSTNSTYLILYSKEMIKGEVRYTTKVDVYSFGIIMWELFFEENPYFNQNSAKIHKFKQCNRLTSLSSEGGLSIIFKVLKGHRPVIPFSNMEEEEIWLQEYIKPNNASMSIGELITVTNEYVELMKMCWDANPDARPTFLEIIQSLSLITHNENAYI